MLAMAMPVSAGKGSPPGNWYTLANIPDPDGAGPGTGLVEGMAVGGVGDIIVAACGRDVGLGDTNLTRLYNIAADMWSLGTPAPLSVAEPAYGELTHAGKLYVIGGRTLGMGYVTQCYDVSSDSWTILAPMPTPRAAAGAAVVGNAIYVIGGRTGASPGSGMALMVVERYDIDTNTWTSVAPLPFGRSDMAVVAHGGKIYVFGGWNHRAGGTVLNHVHVYNPVKDTWTALAPMPRSRYVHMAGKVGNQVYVFGGADWMSVVSGANFVYNISKDSWSIDTPMIGWPPGPGQAVGETGVYSHGGGVYVVGGAQPAWGSSTNFTQVFMP
jgi:N-acetylneuraminic acid mutarotase